MSETLLQIKDLNVIRGGILVLRNINLDIKRGEIVALLGPNGAGKSTLFGSLMGLYKFAKGSIEFAGKQIHGKQIREINKQICLTPQEFATFPFLTVFENLWIAKGSSRQKVLKDEVFNLFPVLHERRNQEACTLSGGERQMLALGIGFVRKSELIMLDEPTLGLAPIMVARILDTIKKISKNFNLSILISEQTPRVLDISDRVYVIEGGEIRLQGKAEDLKKDEKIRKVYLGMQV